ncbi:hypothetical protein HBB16_02125 [Pseudonocardia sp. MCCB 268]|nr:hypothetical protein [Pseudonocardia cytotoxica]
MAEIRPCVPPTRSSPGSLSTAELARELTARWSSRSRTSVRPRTCGSTRRARLGEVVRRARAAPDPAQHLDRPPRTGVRPSGSARTSGLVTSRQSRPHAGEESLRPLLTGHGGSAVDVSSQWSLRVRGALAWELAFGCPLDLHPAEFPAGRRPDHDRAGRRRPGRVSATVTTTWSTSGRRSPAT